MIWFKILSHHFKPDYLYLPFLSSLSSLFIYPTLFYSILLFSCFSALFHFFYYIPFSSLHYHYLLFFTSTLLSSSFFSFLSSFLLSSTSFSLISAFLLPYLSYMNSNFLFLISSYLFYHFIFLSFSWMSLISASQSRRYRANCGTSNRRCYVQVTLIVRSSSNIIFIFRSVFYLFSLCFYVYQCERTRFLYMYLRMSILKQYTI